MFIFIHSGIKLLEIMFFTGLSLSCISIVLGTIDDIKTFFLY